MISSVAIATRCVRHDREDLGLPGPFGLPDDTQDHHESLERGTLRDVPVRIVAPRGGRYTGPQPVLLPA